MAQKLKDAFKIAKIIFKGLFKFFEDLGLDVDQAYILSKDIDDIGDDLVEDGTIFNYVD